VADVVDHPHGDSALRRVLDRAADDRRGLRRKMEVVLRDVERPLRGSDELLDLAGDLDRRLAAVGERANVQRTLTSPPN
jgi:hypothetical protein